jgi:FkbM family methyltransferase
VRGRRARGIAALRKLGAHPWILPLTALLLRARTVRPGAVFAGRELLRRRGEQVYTLRGSGLQVVIRHRTGDVVTLGEVYHEHDYTPPTHVEAALGSVRCVLDLGANVGLFGALAASQWPEARIVAYEPDPANATVHARVIALNGLQHRWQLVQAVAGSTAGTVDFVAGGIALSHLPDVNDGGDPAWHIQVEQRDVLPKLAETDLLKMDIEGGEWAILGDRRFRESPPRAVVLEYHPRFCPSEDPGAEAEAALSAAGMQIAPVWRRADGHGMLWAWRA